MLTHILLAGLVACVATFFLGPALLPLLVRLKVGQNIRTEGPASHQIKAGTPSMGGIIFLLPLLVVALLFGGTSPEVWVAAAATLGLGFIGFSDDYIKVVKKRNLGLTARQKLLGQIVVSALVAVAATYLGRGTQVWLPWNDMRVELGYGYWLFLFFIMVGTSNAVNLTDGLDGLAAGTSVIAYMGMAVICIWTGHAPLAIFCAAVAGAALGFLRVNCYPARVFMGDTGSLALGGGLAVAAVLTGTEVLLALLGGIFVAETLSVILQVISFKTTGKRIFRMSPLHHHFELSGWKETKVVKVFYGVALLCMLAALLVISGQMA